MRKKSSSHATKISAADAHGNKKQWHTWEWEAIGEAEEAEHVPEPLQLHVEVHYVADVKTPVPEEVRGERRGATHREVGTVREVLGAAPAQVGRHERKPQSISCRLIKIRNH